MRTRLLAPVTANLFRLRPQVGLVGGYWSSVLGLVGHTVLRLVPHQGRWSCTPLRNPLVSSLTQPPFGPSSHSPVQSHFGPRHSHVTPTRHFVPAPPLTSRGAATRSRNPRHSRIQCTANIPSGIEWPAGRADTAPPITQHGPSQQHGPFWPLKSGPHGSPASFGPS